jgi:hypothetical protein
LYPHGFGPLSLRPPPPPSSWPPNSTVSKVENLNSTSDSNDGKCDPFSLFTECTLREAMNIARINGNAPKVDIINFNIPDNPNIPGLEVWGVLVWWVREDAGGCNAIMDKVELVRLSGKSE